MDSDSPPLMPSRWTFLMVLAATSSDSRMRLKTCHTSSPGMPNRAKCELESGTVFGD